MLDNLLLTLCSCEITKINSRMRKSHLAIGLVLISLSCSCFFFLTHRSLCSLTTKHVHGFSRKLVVLEKKEEERERERKKTSFAKVGRASEEGEEGKRERKKKMSFRRS